MASKSDQAIAEFNRLIESAKKLPRVEQKARRDRIAIFIAQNLVRNTPVKTGRARGGWGAGAGNGPVASVKFLGKRQGGLLDRRGAKATALMIDTVKSSKWDENIVFRNDVPYIILLDNGYSKTQAPAGIVFPTITAARIRFFG